MTEGQALALGRLLTSYLTQRGMTDVDFSAKAGLYRGKVSQIRKGMVRTLDASDFFRLAWAMGRDPVDLANEVGI